MRKVIFTLMMICVGAATAKPKAQIAILVDTSGSMQGLINQVRDGIWSTLNSLNNLSKGGEGADVELALYQYGSSVVGADSKYIRQLVPLTKNHTLIAEKLFSTKAAGGDEYVGRVLMQAGSELNWSSNSEDFKSIILAGNETIIQGTIHPHNSALELELKSITLNTIFAGSENSHLLDEWRQLALLSSGGSLSIDQNSIQTHIDSPYDDRIINVTMEINTTYLPFGQNGEGEYRRMLDVDRDVWSSGRGSYIGWGSYRSGGFGQNATSSWDLVSAYRLGRLNLASIPDNRLPIVLRGLSITNKLEYIKKVDNHRKQLEKSLGKLREKRASFIQSVRSEQSQNDQENFSAAIRKLISKQLKSQGFTL